MSDNSAAEILQQIADHRQDFRIFSTQVLGSPDGDRPNGRIPLLEDASADHEKRITRIERVILMMVGAAGLLKALTWGAESVAHIFGALK